MISYGDSKRADLTEIERKMVDGEAGEGKEKKALGKCWCMGMMT
jgi:hypothetical protein